MTRALRRTAAAVTLILALIPSAPAAAAETVGRWSLDEGQGQLAADSSPFGQHGRLGAAPHPDGHDPAWVSGRFGSALRFVGHLNQYVSIDRTLALSPQSLTVEAWVRRLGTPGRWRYVVSSGGQGCEFASFGLYSGFNGGLAFYVSDKRHYVSSMRAPAGAVWDGAWHYAVGTYDGHSVRLYLDGVELGPAQPAQVAISYELAASGVHIGTYRGSCELPFTGDVDEVVVRSGALSADQIAVNAVAAGKRPSPKQTPPVSGPPAGEGGASPGCFTVKVSPGRLVAHRRSRLRIAVRRYGRAAARAKVVVRGRRVKAAVRTGANGKARLSIRPRRQGRLRVTVSGQPRRCGARLLPVAKGPS